MTSLSVSPRQLLPEYMTPADAMKEAKIVRRQVSYSSCGMLLVCVCVCVCVCVFVYTIVYMHACAPGLCVHLSMSVCIVGMCTCIHIVSVYVCE